EGAAAERCRVVGEGRGGIRENRHHREQGRPYSGTSMFHLLAFRSIRRCERLPRPEELTVDFLTILPLAFVMIAGPQIISAFFFATSDSWRASSAAYVLGAILSITIVTGAAFLLGVGITGSGDTSEGSKISPLDAVVLVLLLFAMFKQFQ